MGEHNGRRVLTIEEACRRVGVSRRTIYNWIQAKRVEVVRTTTGHVRIYEDTLWARDAAAAQ